MTDTRPVRATSSTDPTPSSEGTTVLSRTMKRRELKLVAIWASMALVIWTQNDGFATASNLRQVLIVWSVLAIVAVGQTLVIVARGIDLSVASTLALAAFGTGQLLQVAPGLPVIGALGASLIIGAALGLVNGLLVGVVRIPAIIATLGTLYLFRGLLSRWAGGGNQINPRDLPPEFLDFGTARIGQVPVSGIIAVAVVVLAALALANLRWGRSLYAVGGNPDAAELAGIHPSRVAISVFVLSGALAGLGGGLWLARFASLEASAARGFEFAVIAAVVVGGVSIFGGVGTIAGAAIGALILATLSNGLTLVNVSAFWLTALYGAAIVVAVTVERLTSTRAHRRSLAGRSGS